MKNKDIIKQKKKEIFLKNADIVSNLEYIEDMFELYELKPPRDIYDQYSHNNRSLIFRRNLYSYKVQIDDDNLLLILLENDGLWNSAKNTGNGMHVVRDSNKKQIIFSGVECWFDLIKFVLERG